MDINSQIGTRKTRGIYRIEFRGGKIRRYFTLPFDLPAEYQQIFHAFCINLRSVLKCGINTAWNGYLRRLLRLIQKTQRFEVILLTESVLIVTKVEVFDELLFVKN
jgi:hypothetical protein